MNPQPAETRRAELAERLASVRSHSLALTAPLSAEDQCVQSMPDASPAKWHLAHTTWFFEAVVLGPHAAGYRPFDARFFHLFNSYYESLGSRHPRPQRGLLTRPGLAEVHAYRAHVDEALRVFSADAGADAWAAAAPLLELGLQHEQQHQELILTDILHALSCNPLLPAYRSAAAIPVRQATPAAALEWMARPGGVVDIGHAGAGVRVRQRDAAARRAAGAAPHRRPAGHLRRLPRSSWPTAAIARRRCGCPTAGRRCRPAAGLAPLYWIAPEDPRAPSPQWQVFGLDGVPPAGSVGTGEPPELLRSGRLCRMGGSAPADRIRMGVGLRAPGIRQMTGHVWQWTRSSYDPYPGFRPLAGAVGEYNGKFMVGQLVLRGGSSATPAGHERPTYRNFFPPGARWQFSGLRLARDGAC